MFEIIKKLASTESEQQAILSLLKDPDNSSILKALGRKLLENSDVIEIDPTGQLIIIVSVAPFAESIEECTEIAKTLKWGMGQNDILPLISEHQGKFLAYRCLLSLAFFHKALEEQTKRHGRPSPDFYRTVGINTYQKMGFDNISHHFTVRTFM